MELLKQHLLASGVEIVSEQLQPNGARRLKLRLADGTCLEVTLSRAMLARSPDDAMSFLEELMKDGARPQKHRHR